MSLSAQAQGGPSAGSQALTNGERLAARIKALPKGRLVTLQVIVGEDGEPLGWVIMSQARLEGLAAAGPASAPGLA